MGEPQSGIQSQPYINADMETVSLYPLLSLHSIVMLVKSVSRASAGLGMIKAEPTFTFL